MEQNRSVIGITMGDPVGIGPEITLLALSQRDILSVCRPFVLGDLAVLESARRYTRCAVRLNPVRDPEECKYQPGTIDVVSLSRLDGCRTRPGKPSADTGKAMVAYVTAAIEMAIQGRISAMVTCPINKVAMQLAGFKFSGHTELLKERTSADGVVMMLAGNTLRVVPVTIHMPLKDVSAQLTIEKIYEAISITQRGLRESFGLMQPRIAVAGLNPHAGEEGMFGDEETRIIAPAVLQARRQGYDAEGPFPSDALFYHARNGRYDAVVCMYHDQGLIAFKMVHFKDGVNTTLGLPIVRTSVDHGTAYDIAGTGKADPGSLLAAIKMAAEQVSNRNSGRPF